MHPAFGFLLFWAMAFLICFNFGGKQWVAMSSTERREYKETEVSRLAMTALLSLLLTVVMFWLTHL